MSYLFRLAMHHIENFLFGENELYNKRPLTEKQADEEWERCKLTTKDLSRAKADIDVINNIL